MNQDRIGILQRALDREKKARRQAEKILESKSAQLYQANQELSVLNKDLESLITRRDSQLQGVFENIVDPYVIMDLSGNILRMNNAALGLLGFEDEKVDSNLMEMVFPEDANKVSEAYEQLLEKGTLTDFEIKIKTNDDKVKLVHINASIIFDNNEPAAAQGIIRDITIVKEKELVVEVINDVAKSILGKFDIYEIAYQITDKIAKYLNSEDCVIYLYHEDDNTLEQISAYGEKLDENNQIINKIVLKEGVGIVGSVAKSGKGEIIGNTALDPRYVTDVIERKSEITIPIKMGDKVLGIIDSEHEEENYFNPKHLQMLSSIANIVAIQLKSAVDLRERKKAEEQLKESENRLSTLILNLDSGVLLEDENRKIVVTNKKFCEFFKIPISPEAMIGQDCSNAAEQSKMLFENPEQFLKDLDKILKNKEMVLAMELKMANGIILERDYIPIYEDKIYKGHLWTYRDVTLSRNYRQSLESQKQKYSNIIANMNLGLMEVDLNDKILMVNNSFSEMSGFSENELLGKVAEEIIPFSIIKDEKINSNLKNSDDIGELHEISVRRKNGEERNWLISGASNYNLNGELTGRILIHFDITDLKNLQRQKEKLVKELENRNNELQEYAHIVSHDLKSPLRSIEALVSWLKEDNKDKLDEASLQNMFLIESTLEKMERLITDILKYSSIGGSPSLEENVQLSKLVEETIQILNVPKHIEIIILKPLPSIKGDRTMLQQVFQNLLSNAIRFIDKDKGIINIDVEDKKNYYQFSVQDNGIGIDEKYHDKIFKIFHSINKGKDSSGIGLSIVKKIIEYHKGKVWLNSEPGVGTTFYFTLRK